MSALRKNEEDIVRLHSEDDLRTYVETLSGHGPQHETVVEVDPDDDLASIRTRLEVARTPWVVLVIPTGAGALRDGLSFRVLRRLQRELGQEMILVSEDAGRRALAVENGFRNVFSSKRAYYRSKSITLEESDGVLFTAPAEFTPVQRLGKWGTAVVALLAAVLAALAYLAVPAATVVVYPEARILARDVDVLVEVGGPRMDLASQRLSGRVVEERAQVQGSINVNDVPPPPDPRASGFPPGTSITLEVRDALRERLISQATDLARQRLREQVRGNESVPAESIRTEVTGERYDRNIGDPTETLEGSIEVVTTALVFNNDDFNRLVFSLWSQDVPRGYRSLGDPALTPPAMVSSEGQRATLRVRATGRLQREVDTEAIAAAVRGNSLPEADRLLARAGDFARPPRITLWPSWVPQAYRVQVKTILEPTP